AVVQARNAAVAADGVAAQAETDNLLTGALRQVFALAEAYPDLKANENFAKLQEDLTETESLIAYSRQHYNDTVLRLNNKVQTVPSNIVASMFGFTEREYFEADGEARGPVNIEF
ncbi:MAG: LemA family protein, partial [Actinobacteria bacterium]|nr:LemA family protein [Actinomycetota bacterium]MBT3969369.1 LemA family protein [Actinomycetota bacterium]MBT4009761.1 LemA family protein [Actinomycetota bacterium]MBT4302827.1 LemA family protein [Actinomycetota bacterium]MBT4477483.1 LemA family protein [Actinomycetota bacterium]